MNLSDYPPIPSDEAVDPNVFVLLKFQIMTASKIPASPQNVSVGAIELLEGRIDGSDKRVYLLQTSRVYGYPVVQCAKNYLLVLSGLIKYKIFINLLNCKQLLTYTSTVLPLYIM